MNSLLDYDELLNAVSGKAVGFALNEKKFYFTSVVTDSRCVVAGSLFIPLIGQNEDGHKYIPQAIQKGATAVFIDSDEYEEDSRKLMELAGEHSHVLFVVVSDTLHALQDAAAAYVAKFPRLLKIGITGSSGKTTTKEMTVAVLKQKYNVIYNEGNLNSETGLPLSVFKIQNEHEIGVFEMGMNRTNEIGEIAAVLKPQYALVTNIGTAHIGILGSRENIAREKRKIFTYIPESGAAFIPSSDDFRFFLSEEIKGHIINYGKDIPLAENGVTLISDDGICGTTFKVGSEEVQLKLPGIYNYQNALGAIAIGRYFGVSDNSIKTALESFMPIAGRTETASFELRGGTCVTLVKDCYNANPDSMAKVLAFCGSVKNIHHRIYVLGDMLELGAKSAEEHANVGAEAVVSSPDQIIFIGTEMKYAAAAAKSAGFTNALYIPDSDDNAMELAAQFLIDCTDDGDLLLLKASRGMQLERIIPLIGVSEGNCNG
ncbi:MAG: UDP-N-acetylmuramoyl-tripeptide--D-alanyl-D-alanine ligase [Treponema sp.]|nr:UDP-N-acetylmuramoyl-tripeptide--D-alanyl-D-alanine ligase [Treponema sp.]